MSYLIKFQNRPKSFVLVTVSVANIREGNFYRSIGQDVLDKFETIKFRPDVLTGVMAPNL